MANQSGSKDKGAKTAAVVGGGLLASLTSGKVLALVIGLHVVAGIGAGYIIVSQIQAKRKLTFSGGPPTVNASQRALEHKVAMGKKKNVMSAPAPIQGPVCNQEILPTRPWISAVWLRLTRTSIHSNCALAILTVRRFSSHRRL